MIEKNPGLGDPHHDRDSCGIGFVAQIDGRPRHRVLEMALEALANLIHRGAVAADGKTGDGSGVQTGLPYALLRRELEKRHLGSVADADLGLGMLFLPAEVGPRERAIEIVEETVADSGLETLFWRRVPLGLDVLGDVARRDRPDIRQIFVRRPPAFSDGRFDRRLYLTRRRLSWRAQQAGITELYAPSFSRRTVVYKGLMLASQLAAFYPDLADPDYKTATAVFHQRYSTNTRPDWRLAQPFRLIAHNGEINTVRGNRNWMRARERELRSALWGERLEDLLPVVQDGGSDSASLDNVLEFLVSFGRDPIHAGMMMIPEAENPSMEVEMKAFYDFHATLMEPWDGPAAVVFSDGRYAGAFLDRNGLRPQRFCVTTDGVVVLGSEAGMVGLEPAEITKKGRLGPGEVLAVDTKVGRLLENTELKRHYARRRPYREWVARRKVALPELDPAWEHLDDPARRRTLQHAFGYGREDLDRILAPMLETGNEPVGSMGDDTPLAALSGKPQALYRYFKQRFAQVTNPPIDPLRERVAMSLQTMVGPWGSVTDEREEIAHLIDFPSPILARGELDWLRGLDDEVFASATANATFRPGEPLGEALARLAREAEAAIDDGATILILSDRDIDADRAPIPMLLATGAVHEHLVARRKRMQISLVCDTGEAREVHHVACLLGYGATLVHPWLATASVIELAEAAESDTETACANYRRALEKGLLKIMSKLGVGPVSSYLGAQLFEVVGLDREIVGRYFSATDSPVSGVDLDGVARDVLAWHTEAFPRDGAEDEPDDGDLPDLGQYRFRKTGETHAFAPAIFKALHKAVRTGDGDAYEHYTQAVRDQPPIHLRDLLRIRRAEKPLKLEEVEPATEIVRRFVTAAMSHGALSREAHEVLAVAMNRLGARSDSGEGGEDRKRFYPYDDDQDGPARWSPRRGDHGNSAIKQVASGRFGVTPEYLVSAEELEIKMAQGSKPGEGGQIPGHKVTAEIARQRHSVPGVTLISPPPHHDIYSIEDLAQLIHDLKCVNPQARVAVKLVATSGIGTIAAGVVKGYADTIHVSGADGGTGASSLSSIHHAGLPWEIGLAETQQVLVANDLRGRVRLRVDGGFETGRDVVIGGILGAEEFAFGTVSLIAAGCIMARQCHLNTCPVGVATQRRSLRERFPGTPEHVISYMLFVAEEVRHLLASMGLRRFDELVGRPELLEIRNGGHTPKGDRLDLKGLLYDPDRGGGRARRFGGVANALPARRAPLDENLWNDVARTALTSGKPIRLEYPIVTRDRSVGARLSGEIARATRGEGLAEGTIEVRFRGAAGQSFGVFLERGIRFRLEGEAQDYVGKGMHGGEIVLKPPTASSFTPRDAVIAGNTLLYGATGGRLFAAGRVGERFAVRCSGAEAVVEGCGDHGCEYMTAGTVVILGPIGQNFAAGMSGGVAFVDAGAEDEPDDFGWRVNRGMVSASRVVTADDALLRPLVERHAEVTGSAHARQLLDDWESARRRFFKVTPVQEDGGEPVEISSEVATTATAATTTTTTTTTEAPGA